MITRRRHLVKSNIKKINESKKKELNKNVEKLEEFKTPSVHDDQKQKKMLKKLKEDMAIQPIKTLRDELEKRANQKNYSMVPPGLTLFCGSTGSGKTVSICNILSKKSMLKDYFDKIIVFCLSPCPMLKDALKLDDKDVIEDDDPAKLRKILSKQKELVNTDKFETIPHILIILDDMAQSRTFLRSKTLQELAFASTHAKISIWITTQSYMQVPRNIRINAHAILLFSGCKLSEVNRFEDEYGSQYLNKRDFRKLVQYCIKDQYEFLFCNNTNPNRAEKYSKGFHEKLIIDKDKVYD
jgi:hypothetical protein